VAVDRRAQALAAVAQGLAVGAGVDLPDRLALWSRAGGRPSAPAVAGSDPAGDLVRAMEGALTDGERRRGAHYTPADLAAEVVARAVVGGSVAVDPACGAGAVLLAAGRRLVELGHPAATVARDLLWGADIDPLAAAVAEAAIALWSGGTAPAAGHVVVADVLATGRGAWPSAPEAGFDAVVGNPPFQGQLAADTARGAPGRAALQARFGAQAAPYVDTAALFLLVAVELAAPGGRVALVQPQSTAAARDAGPVRAAVAERARLVELWVPAGEPFPARVQVCVPVLEVGGGELGADWAGKLAEGRGVPAVDLGSGPVLGSMADAVAGFRQHYYGLVDHVHEGATGAPLVTSGLLSVGACGWGARPARFAKRTWTRPVVDVAAVRAADARLDRWLDRVLRPKVAVATQTRVVEAAADRAGEWVPCTPVVSVVPHDPSAVDLVAAALCAPPASAWAARRAAGTGLSPDAIRMSSELALAVPLPTDRGLWQQAAVALAAGDLAAYAAPATAMYRLPPAVAETVTAWWRTQARQ
jgi:hypothetical protein